MIKIGERQSGLLLIDEMNTTCCYAVQHKVWVYDPDGNAWEIFYTKEDSEFESAGESNDISLCCAPVKTSAEACCTPVSGATTIELGSLKKNSDTRSFC